MDELVECGTIMKAKAKPAAKAKAAPAKEAAGAPVVANAMTNNTVLPPLGGTSTFSMQMNTYNAVQSQKPSGFGASYFSTSK